MTDIVQKDNAILREVAKEIPKEKIRTPAIGTVLSRMKKALSAESDGVAIAAPQIGESLRVFIVSGKVFSIAEDKVAHDHGDREKETPQKTRSASDVVFINPRLTKLSRRKVSMDEGCLSVRYWYGKVARAQKATVEAYDEHGEPFERGASGLLAQIFQHEIDHLDGILFTDKAKGLQEVPPEIKEVKNEKTA